MVDPHQTIVMSFEKDPGQAELGKRGSLQQDLFSKAFHDDKARVFYKVDKDHGLVNGGVVY